MIVFQDKQGLHALLHFAVAERDEGDFYSHQVFLRHHHHRLFERLFY